MSVKIHHIVTGELQNALGVDLLNEAVHPDISDEQRMPYGYRYDIERTDADGRIEEGVMVPVPVWLLEGTEKTIIVDTGLGDPEEVATMQKKYGVDVMTTKSEDQDLVAGLARYGVKPEDVDVVLLTHLHFDHIGNNELFTNATFYVHKDELPQGESPPDFRMYYYPEYSAKIEAVRDRLVVWEGDELEIEPTVRLVKIGGHTPGCTVVMVKTDIGKVCLASDVMYCYRNLELNWPTGSFWHLQELMDGYDRLNREADIVVPEHDWQFLKEFPSGTIG
jgi:glyoxylase-like metal-dependent hydrolase (beta-lactamase superfamily II)